MRYALCGICLLLLVAAGCADHPVSQAAGFHHCVLIYHGPERDAVAFAPYVADQRGWLFDSFLFVRQATSKGVSCSDGPTRRADWAEQLDAWFTAGRDLAALDEAIESESQRLGTPPTRAVVLAVPYPSSAVKDFGDADGDGVSEDLSTSRGQTAAARWYVGEVQRRFAAARLRHLHLWGVYWMREDVSDADVDTIARFAHAIHGVGLRFLWIPYFHATGWQRWRELGFDLAILQPNYAFLDQHRGAIRRNRLAISAVEAREHGLGVEIELPTVLTLPGSTRLFREYLRDGAADRYGYQHRATAYYLGADVVRMLAAKRDPLYADLVAYVHGDTLPEPDPPASWEVAGRPAPWLADQCLTAGRPLAAARTTLPPGSTEALDVFLDEPKAHWAGLIAVEGRAGRGEPWQPVGWAVRTNARPEDGRYQVVTVPLSGSWSALQVRFEGQGRPMVAEVTVQPATLSASGCLLALHAPYRVVPPEAARYGDTDHELTDGVVPEAGFPSGRTVGWIGTDVAISFDLGHSTAITGGEACLQGGSHAAIYWPRAAWLLLATGYPPPGTCEGLGAPPAGLAVVPAGGVVVDRTRSAADQDGHLSFRPTRPVKARYATFRFRPHDWLMLSEIRLFSGGRNVVWGRPYRLQPAPTPVPRDVGYPDNGRLLTDGIVAQTFSPASVYGWADGTPRAVEVDLGRRCSLTKVVVWSLADSGAAVCLPSSVRLWASDDGQAWRDLGAAHRAVPKEPRGPCPFTLSLGGQPARYLRTVVTPSQGWSMISEIEVGGKAG